MSQQPTDSGVLSPDAESFQRFHTEVLPGRIAAGTGALAHDYLSGKGTLARRVAEAMDYAYLDTGLLYRATGAKVLAENGDPADEAAAVAATDAQASTDAGAAADTEVQADVTADANTPEQLTTVDGFDLEKVQTMIDTSDLPATQKALLKQGLVTAGENPDALRAILARIREALAL